MKKLCHPEKRGSLALAPGNGFSYTCDLLTFLRLTSFSVQAHLPFAVVGSVEEVKVGNKTVRARQYPWGVVQGEDHSQFKLISVCVGFSNEQNCEHMKE